MPENSVMRSTSCSFAVGLSALALASCGGSGTKVVTETTSAGPASTATQATTASTPTSSTRTQTATVPTGSRCTAAKLSLSFLGQQGATGHGVIGFLLRNRSSSSCHTFGYPGVLFLSRSGAALPTVAARVTQDFAGSAPKVSLNLAPGVGASFRLTVTHFTSSGTSAGCTTAAGLQVIPPDDTATLRISIPGGAYECGRATVSPLRPGTSAYP